MTCLNLKRKVLILEGEYGMHDKKSIGKLNFFKNHTEKSYVIDTKVML